jgi:hypothetical protein
LNLISTAAKQTIPPIYQISTCQKLISTYKEHPNND